LVAHPELVDLWVLARAITLGLVVARVEVEPRAAAGRAALADALGRAQKPNARLEAEVLGRERAHRADVVDHHRVVAVELTPGRDDDLFDVAALALIEHRIFGDLRHEADAARADDAALGVVDDRRPEGDALRLVDRLVAHALLVLAVLEPIILELALAGLIADRTIDRVLQEQELLHVAPRFDDVVARVGAHVHAVGGRDL